MLKFILALLGGPLVNKLLEAYKAKLDASNNEKRIIADTAIEDIKAQIAAKQVQGDVVKEAMQHRMFWVAWSMAAIPTAAWYGWGMLDSMLYAGTLLPDVASLPPQLKEFADVVWDNLFVSGSIVASTGLVANAIRGRK